MEKGDGFPITLLSLNVTRQRNGDTSELKWNGDTSEFRIYPQ